MCPSRESLETLLLVLMPFRYKIREILADKDKQAQLANEAKQWIQAGMKEDAK